MSEYRIATLPYADRRRVLDAVDEAVAALGLPAGVSVTLDGGTEVIVRVTPPEPRGERAGPWTPPVTFDAYYYSLTATGDEKIDAILKAVARAGKGCHNTEDWNASDLVRPIQEAADCAALTSHAREEPMPEVWEEDIAWAERHAAHLNAIRVYDGTDDSAPAVDAKLSALESVRRILRVLEWAQGRGN